MNPRRKSFVDPEVQGALARRLTVHWIIYLVVATALILGLKWMANPFAPFSEHLHEAATTYSPVLLVLVCLAPIFVFDSVKMSNRFTGPMFRIRSAARQLAAGERAEKIKLRGGDFWKELAADFNRLIDRIDSEQADQKKG